MFKGLVHQNKANLLCFAHNLEVEKNDNNSHKSGGLVQMIYHMVLKPLSEMRWKTSMTKDSQGILLRKHIFQAIKCFLYDWNVNGFL